MPKNTAPKNDKKCCDTTKCGCPANDSPPPGSSTPKGFKFPTHGWGRAMLFAVIMTIAAAIAMTIIPPKNTKDKSGEGADEPGVEIAEKIEKIQSGKSDTEIILSQGSTEAPSVEPPQPPGGLSWESLRYPNSERLLMYSGRKLKADEQAYVSTDPYENVKAYYVQLITTEFRTAPQTSEMTDARGTQLTVQNQTGSLSVWVKVPPYEKKVYILVTKLENISDENLKPFGGPKEEQEKKLGKGK
jgi:hypothetical protein